MKWPAFLLAGVAVLLFLCSVATVVPLVRAAEISSIAYLPDRTGEEGLEIVLTEPVAAKIFTLSGEKPRLVLDFPDSTYAGKEYQPLSGASLATAIRTGFHREPKQKTRIVVDLLPGVEVRHSHEYLEDGRRLLVRLAATFPEPAPTASEPTSSTPEPAPTASEPTSSTPETAATTPEPAPTDPSSAAAPSPAEGVLVTELPSPAALSSEEEGPAEPGVDRRPAGSGGTAKLLKISFDDSSNRGEMVLFHLNDFYPPTVAAIEKENPRVLCDFVDTVLGDGVEKTIAANGRHVKQIRTARHTAPDKIRVVIDLSPDRDYDLQQVFFKNDNLFVLIINELAPGEFDAQSTYGGQSANEAPTKRQ